MRPSLQASSALSTFVCLTLVWLLALGAHADDASARRLFEAGVAAAAGHDWNEAARLLEASLEQRDRPACRFNLISVNHELKRPLEVARHALGFLAMVEARAHMDEADEARRLLDLATRELVVLQTHELPLGTQTKVDGAAPRVSDGGRIYVLPGSHRLELWLGERVLESIEIQLAAGMQQPWPRVRVASTPQIETTLEERPQEPVRPQLAPIPVAVAVAAAQAARRSLSLRQKLALGLAAGGVAVGIAAVADYGYVAQRANVLHDAPLGQFGPARATDRYTRAMRAVLPLAFTAGALMAGAAALVGHKPRAAPAISIGALLLAAGLGSLGVVLLARTPQRLAEGTELRQPTREAGGLLIAGALPLLSYGVRLQWDFLRAP